MRGGGGGRGGAPVAPGDGSRRSLLDLLLPLLLRQAPLGLLVQVIGQLLLVGPPLLLRRHLVLRRTTDAT